VPVPYATLAQGVVRLPETAMLRARTDGIISRVLVAPGQQVHRGDPIIVLEDPVLPARLAVLRGQQQELTLRHDAALQTDRVSAKLLADEAAQNEAAVSLAGTRLAEQVLHAPRDGVLVLPDADALTGRFVREGERLGEVLAADDITIRVAVPQEQIDLVRRHSDGVALRLAHDVFHPMPARLVRELPAAMTDMPSPVLGLAAGGDIATDPRDESGVRAFEQTFLVDVTPRAIALADVWTGERAYVRFDHGAQPLGWRLLRDLRSLFLRRLDV
jgi:putative peptide zinc metalloprotease protein